MRQEWKWAEKRFRYKTIKLPPQTNETKTMNNGKIVVDEYTADAQKKQTKRKILIFLKKTEW